MKLYLVKTILFGDVIDLVYVSSKRKAQNYRAEMRNKLHKDAKHSYRNFKFSLEEIEVSLVKKDILKALNLAAYEGTTTNNVV